MNYPLKAANLSFAYPGNDRRIIDGVNFSINRGEIKAIVGLSGSGKTSLCYCLSGIIPHIYKGNLSGDVSIEGSPVLDMKIQDISTKVGIVFQNPETQLFFPVVEDELAFGPENLCVPREEIGRRITKNLRLLAIEKLRYSDIRNLSGGQKQLVALSCVLTLQPDILLFDEVMSQIDKKGKKRIKEVILDLKSRGKAIVIVEHDLNNIDIADNVLLLKKGRLHKFAGKF